MNEKTKKTLWKIFLIVVGAVVIISSGSTAIANIKNSFKDDKTQEDSSAEAAALEDVYQIDYSAVV